MNNKIYKIKNAKLYLNNLKLNLEIANICHNLQKNIIKEN